jgi:hypothetical protein
MMQSGLGGAYLSPAASQLPGYGMSGRKQVRGPALALRTNRCRSKGARSIRSPVGQWPAVALELAGMDNDVVALGGAERRTADGQEARDPQERPVCDRIS